MNKQVPGADRAKYMSPDEQIRQMVAGHKPGIGLGKVTEIPGVMKYGVMMTPGLVVDGVVKSIGLVLKDERLLGWLKGMT